MAFPKKIYRQNLDKANTQDRLRAVYAKSLSETELSDFERDRLSQYTKVGSLLTYNLSIKYAMLTIAKEYGLSESQAYCVVREAMLFYGDVMKFSKEAQRYFLYEKFIQLAIKAEKESNLQQAESCYDKAAKIYKLYEHESGLPDVNLYMPTVIVPILVDTTPPPDLKELLTIRIDP